MADISQLSPAQCVLLAVHYATEANITALHTLIPSRSDAFEPELVLRILLTYLPESVEPSTYTTFVGEVAKKVYVEQRRASIDVDVSPVKDIPEAQAIKRVRKLHLLPLRHRAYETGPFNNLLAHFLVHRAHRIDAQTGLLNLVPQLVDPFVEQYPDLRAWFVSCVLPLLRVNYEYYPQISPPAPPLEEFVDLTVPKGLEALLSYVKEGKQSAMPGGIARDFRGLVAPWMYGDSLRKRRRLARGNGREDVPAAEEDMKRLGMNKVEEQIGTGHDWEPAFIWMVRTARKQFVLVTEAIEGWDGPTDVDFGGYAENEYLEEDVKQKLAIQFAQAAFASVYAAETDSPETIEGAHSVLVRLAQILYFDPPPDLATSVELLPKVDSQTSIMDETSKSMLVPDVLSRPGHPLTAPTLESFSLLQMFVYSAYLLAGLSHSISIVNAAKLRFYSDEEEQLAMVQKILHTLSAGPKKDDHQWALIRNRLLWLWHWGMDAEEDTAQFGAGIFGKIERSILAQEIVKAMVTNSCYSLVISIYLQKPDSPHRLPADEVERIVIETAMHYYDNASNGNRTRGQMKKASDLISVFRPYFPESSDIRRCEALLSATHALSFYSLTLQHGVPFQPVNIRVIQDPISLIGKVLDQNLRSYTKLDDLISIGKNLVEAGGLTESLQHSGPVIEPSPDELEQQKRTAERRIIGMAIEAALAENDFETAYSYVINRLNPPSAAHQQPPQSSADAPSSTTGKSQPSPAAQPRKPEAAEPDDDISWRAAFLAGRHRSTDSSPGVRRLEQRMELLSQALLLAPPSALPEVLAAWRRCEEEMTALLARETEAEQAFDDRADRRVPGGFGDVASQGVLQAVQPRREVGRGAVEEAPMGLFDVARGAAAAFSRSAFPLRGAAMAAGGAGEGGGGHVRSVSAAGSETGSLGGGGSDGEGRVRKRDIVANAVTGGLASGLGWVLGVTPVQNQSRD